MNLDVTHPQITILSDGILDLVCEGCFVKSYDDGGVIFRPEWMSIRDDAANEGFLSVFRHEHVFLVDNFGVHERRFQDTNTPCLIRFFIVSPRVLEFVLEPDNFYVFVIGFGEVVEQVSLSDSSGFNQIFSPSFLHLLF